MASGRRHGDGVEAREALRGAIDEGHTSRLERLTHGRGGVLRARLAPPLVELQLALDELHEAKRGAEAEVAELRQLVSQKEGMLQFVEQEVHSVKALFAEKEREDWAKMEEELAHVLDRDRLAERGQSDLAISSAEERMRWDMEERRKRMAEAAARA